MPKRPGTRVNYRGITAYVEEYDHAYLVRGYGFMYGITIQQARLALFQYLGRKKWSRIIRMPARPFYTSELGDKEPTGAVGFYFNIGPGATGNEYKP